MTETTLTREQVRANRIKWIEFLEQPERKKHQGELENSKNPESRCCLGHGCAVFELERIEMTFGDIALDEGLFVEVQYDGSESTAPDSLVDLLGLWDGEGGTESNTAIDVTPFVPNANEMERLSLHQRSLAMINDQTIATPQQIAAYLRTVIEGGKGTPFRPLSDYPEA